MDVDRPRVVRVTGGEQGRWNALVARHQEFVLMQGYEWGEFKRALGWRVVRLAVERGREWIGGAQVFIRSFAGAASIAYIPRGPLVNWEDRTTTAALLTAIHKVARRHRVAFLKIEPPVRFSPEAHRLLSSYGFRPGTFHNQPRSTLVIDLNGEEQEILARMSPKTRHNIRYGERHGVRVEEGSDADLGVFYRLLRETARHAGFPIRPLEYYRQEWAALSPSGSLKLFLARYRGEVVAMRVPAACGRWAATLHSGSSVAHRKLKLNEPLMWASIRWARARGCTTYDEWGIPDEVGAHLYEGRPLPADRTGGLWGVYRFKRGFGGRVVYYVGAYAFIYKPTLYRLANLSWKLLGSSDRLARLGDLLGRKR